MVVMFFKITHNVMSTSQPGINKPQTAVQLGRYHKKVSFIMTIRGVPP